MACFSESLAVLCHHRRLLSLITGWATRFASLLCVGRQLWSTVVIRFASSRRCESRGQQKNTRLHVKALRKHVQLLAETGSGLNHTVPVGTPLCQSIPLGDNVYRVGGCSSSRRRRSERCGWQWPLFVVATLRNWEITAMRNNLQQMTHWSLAQVLQSRIGLDTTTAGTGTLRYLSPCL